MFLCRLVLVHVRDHYSTTEQNDEPCIAEFAGVVIEETDDYLYLRHICSAINRDNSAEEIHVVLKSAIKQIWSFDIDEG